MLKVQHHIICSLTYNLLLSNLNNISLKLSNLKVKKLWL